MPSSPRTTEPPDTPAAVAPDERRIEARRRYHFGLPGVVYIFVTLLVALGAFNSQNNLLFWAFGFALALLVISGFLSGAMLMGIEVVREPVSPLVEDEPGAVHYRVRNRNRLVPAFALTIAEVTPGSLPRRGPPAPTHEAEPDVVTFPHAFVPHVAPGRTASGAAPLRALRRGEGAFDAILLSTSFPFGLIKKSLLFEQRSEVLVRPRTVPLPHGFVNSALRSGDRGQAPTRRAGAGDDFFSLREYQPGDALRDIAWRASARRDELLVRQTASPAPMRMQVVLSFENSPGDEADEEAIRLAASAAEAALARGLAVGLRVLHTDVELRPRDGRLQRELLLDTLARLRPHLARAATPDTPTQAEHDARLLRSQGILVLVYPGSAPPASAPPWALHLPANHPPPPSSGAPAPLPPTPTRPAQVHA